MFRQLLLNQWVKQNVRWMPMEKWGACAFPVDEDDKYIVLPYFWLPEDTLSLRVRRDHVPYDVWERQGSLMTTEGNVVHYGFIEQFISCTLHYVQKYTKFCSTVSEQEGNYLAIKVEADPAARVKFHLVGGTKGEFELAPDDMQVVCLIRDKDKQSIKITALKDGKQNVKNYSLTALRWTLRAVKEHRLAVMQRCIAASITICRIKHKTI